MAYEQKELSGSLFINDRKEKDTHPDRTGTALIDGVEYWVSGWLKQGAKGQFLSLAFKRREIRQGNEPPPRRAPPRQQPSLREELNDDVPF